MSPRKVLYHESSLITPLYTYLDQFGRHVYIKLEPTKATFTWLKITHGDQLGNLTMQAVLHEDGRIQFNYPDVEQTFTPAWP